MFLFFANRVNLFWLTAGGGQSALSRIAPFPHVMARTPFSLVFGGGGRVGCLQGSCVYATTLPRMVWSRGGVQGGPPQGYLFFLNQPHGTLPVILSRRR